MCKKKSHGGTHWDSSPWNSTANQIFSPACALLIASQSVSLLDQRQQLNCRWGVGLDFLRELRLSVADGIQLIPIHSTRAWAKLADQRVEKWRSRDLSACHTRGNNFGALAHLLAASSPGKLAPISAGNQQGLVVTAEAKWRQHMPQRAGENDICAGANLN